jgi:hypothetical protein
MISKVSHDKYGGTQIRGRSVPNTLDKLDRSDESPTMLILSASIHFAGLTSAAKAIASLIMFFRYLEFSSVLRLFDPAFWQRY